MVTGTYTSLDEKEAQQEAQQEAQLFGLWLGANLFNWIVIRIKDRILS